MLHKMQYFYVNQRTAATGFAPSKALRPQRLQPSQLSIYAIPAPRTTRRAVAAPTTPPASTSEG